MKMYIEPISKEALNRYLAITDLTDSPKPHAIKMVYEKIAEYMRSTHPRSSVRVYRKNPSRDENPVSAFRPYPITRANCSKACIIGKRRIDLL